jgi:hypothetical protein
VTLSHVGFFGGFTKVVMVGLFDFLNYLSFKPVSAAPNDQVSHVLIACLLPGTVTKVVLSSCRIGVYS